MPQKQNNDDHPVTINRLLALEYVKYQIAHISKPMSDDELADMLCRTYCNGFVKIMIRMQD